MATNHLAELQRDLSIRITRILPTGVVRRHDSAEDDNPETVNTAEADIAEDAQSETVEQRYIRSSNFPLAARRPPRGHVEDDWRARPTKERPWPVVLIHGTSDSNGIWEKLTHNLRTDGWAVFIPGFGNRSTLTVEESASQVGAYVDAVLTVTGAEKVILVGHSQGGVVARYWMHVRGGAPKVKHLVSLAAPNHGTTMGGMISSIITTRTAESMMNSLVQTWFGPSGFQLITGHPIINDINVDGDTESDVGYTCIATRYDSLIQPPESCFLYSDDPEANITNFFIQDIEPRARVLHEDMPVDARVRHAVRAALDAIDLPA